MTPLLLIPGTLCDRRLFAAVERRLDLPVVHAAPIRQPTVGEAADAVLAAAPPHFVVGGFSLGGFVALEVLRRAPERATAAVLIDSNARPDPPANAAARRAQVETARRDGPAALIDMLWPAYVAPASLDRADLRALLVGMAEEVGVDAFAAQAELAIARPDARAFVAACPAPLLVIHGAEDGLCHAAMQDELAAAPHATRVGVDAAGHFAPLEQPAAVAQAIAAWWPSARAAAA